MTNVYLENYANLPRKRFCLLASRKFKLREIDAIFWQKKPVRSLQKSKYQVKILYSEL